MCMCIHHGRRHLSAARHSWTCEVTDTYHYIFVSPPYLEEMVRLITYEYGKINHGGKMYNVIMYHSSTCSLKYHLNAKHLVASSEVRPSSWCESSHTPLYWTPFVFLVFPHINNLVKRSWCWRGLYAYKATFFNRAKLIYLCEFEQFNQSYLCHTHSLKDSSLLISFINHLTALISYHFWLNVCLRWDLNREPLGCIAATHYIPLYRQYILDCT